MPTSRKPKPSKSVEPKSTAKKSASPRSAGAVHPIYSVHPGVLMVQDWIAKLPEKTGRSLEQWVELLRNDAPKTIEAQRAWLKEKHGLGTNSAWWLADYAVGKGEDDTPEKYLRAADEYVEAMYAGPKSALRPMHDALIELARSLGPDIRICPCKTIVPIYRKNVIAEIKPSTRTRIDFGFSLGRMKASGRLIDTGGFAKKDRITHRIPVEKPSDVDDELKRWLKKAYELNA